MQTNLNSRFCCSICVTMCFNAKRIIEIYIRYAFAVVTDKYDTFEQDLSDGQGTGNDMACFIMWTLIIFSITDEAISQL